MPTTREKHHASHQVSRGSAPDPGNVRRSRVSTEPEPAPVVEPSGNGAVTYEEILIIDARAGQCPAQAVEDKLCRMLSDASLPVSYQRMRAHLKKR
jgi:hypothetical protein